MTTSDDKLQYGHLAGGGIPVVIKKSSTLEHNKYAVIDGERVVMVSWNWSKSAQKQDNSNVILYDCPDEVAKFEAAFRAILERDSDHSVTLPLPSHSTFTGYSTPPSYR